MTPRKPANKPRAFVALPQRAPQDPLPLEEPDLHAIHALVRGDATQDQQFRFVQWFNRATGVSENPFRSGPDGARETDFACGKRFVGDQFYSIAKMKPPKIGD